MILYRKKDLPTSHIPLFTWSSLVWSLLINEFPVDEYNNDYYLIIIIMYTDLPGSQTNTGSFWV